MVDLVGGPTGVGVKQPTRASPADCVKWPTARARPTPSSPHWFSCRRNQLELHPEKTRLIEFGRFAAENRARRGDRKPETFEFLGFTHICATKRNGGFKLKRVTSKKKMRSTLKSVKTEMRRRAHLPIPDQGRWLASVLQGHYNYYAVPDNGEALRAFRVVVIRHWKAALSSRSQKGWITWKRTSYLADRWLPQPRILHPWPQARFYAKTQGRSPVR